MTLAVMIGGALSLALFASADVVATRLLHDALIARRCFACSLRCRSRTRSYSTAIGHLNGQRVFARQARLDASFTLVRTTGLLVGGALAIGALGAAIGFASAAVVMACVGLAFVGIGRAGSTISPRVWLAFFAAIALHQLALNGLLQLDVEILKSRVATLAMDAGANAVDAASLASTEAGLYRAAQSVAFVPYQLILAVTLVLFPTVARARTVGDEEGARRAVRGALRFATIALVLVAAPVAGGGDAAIRVLLDARYAPGGDALAILALGQIAFTLFVVGSTAISGDGSPFVVAASALVGLVVIGDRRRRRDRCSRRGRQRACRGGDRRRVRVRRRARPRPRPREPPVRRSDPVGDLRPLARSQAAPASASRTSFRTPAGSIRSARWSSARSPRSRCSRSAASSARTTLRWCGGC